MPVPILEMWTVASYVVGQRLRGWRRYPLVLMLELILVHNLPTAQPSGPKAGDCRHAIYQRIRDLCPFSSRRRRPSQSR
ncbi:MAG: hypothetical protein CBB69_002145 [Phycisphaera sp. TMED9]|nr:MAG: hypothetical protein CBB69_002145 [Phycisphaera sp. TMED9]